MKSSDMRLARVRSSPSLVLLSLLLANFLASTVTTPAQTSESAPQKLEAAIGTLRHIDEAALSEEQQKQKAAEIEAAWSVIKAAGKDGIARLKQEVHRVDASGERDYFFKLNASRLLWMVSHLDEASTITNIWNSTPLEAQYYYVFYTAFEAALTQDPRALPMLQACLKDKRGRIFVAAHSLEVQWPLTVEFIWGAFGAKGLPILASILETSRDPVELQSAAALLSEGQYAEALPALRKLIARSDIDKPTRSIAVRVLGTFGHPQDYSYLAAGLNTKEPDVLTDFAYALYEYEDLRAVPLLAPLLKTENDPLKKEVIAALIHLTSIESFEALRADCVSKATPEERESCFSQINSYLEGLPINLSTFSGLSAEAKTSLIASIRKSAEDEYVLQPGDQKLAREDFLELVGEWKRSHRLKSDKFDWVEAKHILSVATPGDLNSLIDARAAIYGRLSDECLYEVSMLNRIIRRLGRTRYRKTVGLTDNNTRS